MSKLWTTITEWIGIAELNRNVEEMTVLIENLVEVNESLLAQVADLREQLNLEPMQPKRIDPTDYMVIGGDPQLGH